MPSAMNNCRALVLWEPRTCLSLDGPLQLGERYANRDYLFYAALGLRWERISELGMSYDGSFRLPRGCGYFTDGEGIENEWTGAFWETTTLAEAGLVYQLGHRGRRCPTPAADPATMHIFDTTGVQKVEMRYCECVDAATEVEQLLDAGWHRASAQSNCCQTWALLAQLEKLGSFEPISTL
ncbi:hypothetical protein C8R46DRAFT_1218171 [Mycena filopes]|nr:hypothetical protein C8R46DRAFT_1218171 [Mycena filopes]